MSTLRPDLKTNDDLKKAVLAAVKQHHLWINAFTLVRPTDETYREIGKLIVAMLQDRDNLIPAYHGGAAKDSIDDIARLTPCLYLYINAS